MDAPPDPTPRHLSHGLVLFMAISVGLIVANIYYVQPLLADVARTFNISAAAAGGIAMTTQIGTALGMLFFVPLGDSVERRSLITKLLVLESVFLVLGGLAPNPLVFALAGAGIGMAGCAVHVFVPFAAHLAPPAERGKVLGTVLSGVLLGILLARTFSGIVGEHLGWRAVYFIASGMMIGLLLLIGRLLPKSEPSVEMPYGQLLRSVLDLAREYASLREAALIGACLFCAFSAFWTALVFFLQTPPYHYGSAVAGEFGLVGAAGAAGAPIVGRLTDKFSVRKLVAIAVAIVFVSYLILGFLGHSMAALIIGVVLLDFGVQSGHVSNQSRIYALNVHARSRLNTFYMVCYFLGGSVGSVASGYCWQFYGWTGVCGFALLVLTVAMVYLARAGTATIRDRSAAGRS